jgi:hypothetical protein
LWRPSLRSATGCWRCSSSEWRRGRRGRERAAGARGRGR